MFTTERERKLQGFLEKVVKEREKNGLNVNCNNCMRLSAKGKKKHPTCGLRIGGNKIKQVENFQYLGSV